MGFILSGNNITQSGTDTDLSGIVGNGGTRTFEGEIAVYTTGNNQILNVTGTLTIDPEKERLNMRANKIIDVQSGGHLIVGATTTTDGYERFHQGVAICSSRAQLVWSGSAGNNNNNGIGVDSGGTLEWISGTIQGPFGFNTTQGSTVWIRDGIWKPQDVDKATIDPQTGSLPATNSGTYEGISNSNAILLTGRGFLSYFLGTDMRIDKLTTIGGGELVFNSIPSGTNGESGTANGIFGLVAEETVVGIFSRSRNIASQTFGIYEYPYSNISVSGKGNVADLAIQSINGGGDRFNNITVTNAAGGTSLNILAAEQSNAYASGDNRNKGSCAIYRETDFNFTDGITGTALTGGRYYMIDTNNGNRQDSGGAGPSNQGFDFDQDFVYSNTFTSGASTGGTEDILLGAVQSITATSGLKVFPNRDNDPTQTVNPDNTVSPSADTTTWRMDIRGVNNTLGDDKFDFHIWRYENNYLPLSNTPLSDGLTGAITISPRSVTDGNITNTRATIDALNTSIGSNFVVSNSGITTGSTSVNLDQVYDLCKYKKETSAANLIIPSSSTLIISSDGTELDLGTRTITQGSGLWTVGSTHNKVSHDTLLDLSKFTLAGGIELTAPTLNNLPASIGTSILNPTNTIAGTGGHTSVSTSVINGDVDITGSSSNILGGLITGALDLKGGDTDFNGSVDEVGGITTGNITLGSTSLRTIDFKAGSTTKGTISASTVTNLVLDGTHEKAVTRSVGTATTSADGSIAGILILGNGVLTSGSTFVCDETVTAGNGDHSVAGTIAKKLTLGNGDSTVNATVSSGGLDLGTGDQTINGNITGAVATDGTLTTGSTFIASSTVTASTATGDQSIDGAIAGDVTLGAATSGHTIDGALSSKLIMGTGAHTINGTVTGTISTTGTLTTGLVYSGGSTVAASGTGDSTIRGTTTGLLTLGNASVGHTLNGTFTGGFTIGTGASSFDGTGSADSQAGNGNFSFNGALTGDFTHGTGTLIFGPSASMTGTLTKSGSLAANGLTLTTDQASTIDLVVTTGTLELFGAVRNDYNSVTGLTNDNAIPTTTTFQVGSGLPSGRVIFRERAAAAGTHLIDSTHTEGATTTLGVINNNSGSPTNYDIYYKPTNTFGDDGVFWAVTVVNSDNGATTNRTIDVTSTPHAGVLTRAAEDADLTGLTATMDAITTGTTGNINITGATTQIDAPQTQALMLRVTDDANYLNLLANTNAEMDDILPGIQSGSSINQSRLTLQATNQQSITALAGTGTGTLIGTITVGGLTFAAVFIFPNPSGLSGPEAQVACEAAIDGRAASGQSIQTAVTDCLKRGDLTEIGQE